MSFSSKLAAITAVGAVALVPAGCSSSKARPNGRSTTATRTEVAAARPSASASGQEIQIQAGKALSRATLISQADAICSRANAKVSTSTARTEEDFARMLPQAASYERTEALELSKLVPPSAMSADWQHIITDLQKYSEFSSRAGEYAAVKNFPAALPIAISGNKTQQDMVAVAKRDGFKICSIP